MAVYVAAYDLHKPDRDYEPLYEYLKSFDSWAHCIDSVWLLDTNKTATDIRDGMLKNMHNRDTILVIRVNKDAAWNAFGDCGNWVLSDDRNW